jgi:hypothetical protein
MKNTIILLWLFMIIGFSQVHAQTLTYKNSGVAVGDVFSYISADTANVLPGPAGSNITWDFSGLVIGPDIQTSTIISPAATPYSDSFPLANAATKNNGNYSYIKCDSTEYTSLGSANSNSVFILSDPMIYYKYPVSYGYSFTDSFSADNETMTLKGVQIRNADGKGTMKLAGQNFNNVLRIKSISYRIDSSSFVTTEMNIVSYSWYDGIHKTPLLSISDMQIITSFGDTLSDKSVVVSNDIITNINKNYALAETKFEIYPNPAQNFITLSFNVENPDVKTTCDIRDLSGRTVKEQMLSDAVHGKNTLRFDLTELPRGIYFVNLLQGNLTARSKLVLY